MDASGVPEMLDEAMPRGGRPRQLGARTVLLGVMVALNEGRPAQLEAAWRALSNLAVPDQLSLGFATSKDGATHSATYRQVSDTFSVMCHGVDPTPVPSFRSVPEAHRALHLAAARSGVDAVAKEAHLAQLCDVLIEASVPVAYQNASRSLAVDWSDLESFSRPPGARGPPTGQRPRRLVGPRQAQRPGGQGLLVLRLLRPGGDHGG